MIKAFHKNNLRDYKRVCAFHQFVARGIRAYLYPLLFLAAAVLFLIIAVSFSNTAFYALSAGLLLFGIALPFLTLFFQNVKLEKSVRENENYEKTTMFYEFHETDFLLKIKVGQRTEEHTIPFEQVLRIYERNDCFYLYIGRSQVLILNKENIEEGKTDELVGLFRSIGKRFKEKSACRNRMQLQ